jgi:hypothetical protein
MPHFQGISYSLKMEAAGPSKIVVSMYPTIWCHILEAHKNLKFHNTIFTYIFLIINCTKITKFLTYCDNVRNKYLLNVLFTAMVPLVIASRLTIWHQCGWGRKNRKRRNKTEGGIIHKHQSQKGSDQT